MEVISRAQAKEKGLKHYFTGKPCKHGHISKRIVSSFGCLECHNLRATAESTRKYYAEYRSKNKRRIKEIHKAWREKNKEKIAQWGAVFREENPDIVRQMDRDWNSRNRSRKNAHRAKRRARIDMRTPAWADLDAINFFYECCPAGCHVDHIIPLKGKKISGLHIAENLQWLPARQNLKKSNKWK